MANMDMMINLIITQNIPDSFFCLFASKKSVNKKKYKIQDVDGIKFSVMEM